jgi:hypothetical protein
VLALREMVGCLRRPAADHTVLNHFQASTSCFTSARCDRPDGFLSLIPALTLSCPRFASQYDYICNRSALIDPPSSRDSPVPPR